MENSTKEGVVTLPSGLQYKIIKQGTGAVPTAQDKVKTHYTGTLIDGTKFDSSVDRGEPATFGVTQVIKGWVEALQLMPEGSKWELYIPHTLAYENAKKEGVVTLPSGLQYEIMTEGSGEKPAATDTVKTHYHGTLIDGTVFDSSVQRGEPISFPLNGVISGWTEGLQLMPVGSKWRLFVPSNLAYGERGQGAIQPHSTLVFEVELLGIEKGEPIEFPVNGVIPGWTEALQLMPAGSKWELYIPYDLAYGAQGAGGSIPPYATLIFEVELLE
eukprot:maker-scaffold2108_size20737-snap-gene-0.0 protein:Tk00106 transcript:maker-scaffold2108_size20737-snap-gene-0.0-mRNA-1 annotation:"peptidylprolyl isomerase"